MIYYKSTLSNKDKLKISSIVYDIEDIYNDFYLTKNNYRYFIKEHFNLLFSGLTKGDKIVYNDNGLLLVVGFSDKSPRKYIKLLSNEENAIKLVRILYWNLNIELFAKLKYSNPLINVLYSNGFKFYRRRGKEILLKRNKGVKYD